MRSGGWNSGWGKRAGKPTSVGRKPKSRVWKSARKLRAISTTGRCKSSSASRSGWTFVRRLLERDQKAALEELRQLREQVRRQVAELRLFLRTMRPQQFEGTDLVAFARRISEDFQKDTGIPVRFSSSDAVLNCAPETCQEMMQILREALKNIQKHSRAGRVSVNLQRSGRHVEMAVDDNGAGFGFSGSFTLEELELLQLGPQSIKRRVRSLGGELLIESRPGHGAGLRIRIPA
jgi:two-component system sensor histidine kinase DegS